MQILKNILEKKYNLKDLFEINIIIKQQITKNIAIHTIKIDQSIFIKDLIIKKKLRKCNTNIILMKVSSAIKLLEFENYTKTDFHKY